MDILLNNEITTRTKEVDNGINDFINELRNSLENPKQKKRNKKKAKIWIQQSIHRQKSIIWKTVKYQINCGRTIFHLTIKIYKIAHLINKLHKIYQNKKEVKKCQNL